MSKKLIVRILAWTVTVVVALWGLVVLPLQCMNAVKPFVGTRAFWVVHPWIGPAVLALYFGFRWNPGHAGGTSRKAALVMTLWLASLFGAFFSFDLRDSFLRKQIIWSGACTPIAFSDSQNGFELNLQCGPHTAHAAGIKIANAFLSGKPQIECAVNFFKIASCTTITKSAADIHR